MRFLKQCLQALPPSPSFSRIPLAADPACRPLAFSIVLTDREPGAGYSVWSNTSIKNIKTLQLVQNFAARIVLDLKKYDHISEGLESLGWLDINHKLKFNDCVMMYRCLNEGGPAMYGGNSRSARRSMVELLGTGNRYALDLIKCCLATGQQSFSFQGAKTWNVFQNLLELLPRLVIYFVLGIKSKKNVIPIV